MLLDKGYFDYDYEKVEKPPQFVDWVDTIKTDEEVVDMLCDELKMRQVERLQHRQGNIVQNWIFDDLLTNLERVSDHCMNIANTTLHKAA